MDYISFFGLTMPLEYWVILVLALAMYLYVYVNFIIRKTYLKAAYLDDSESFDLYDAKIQGGRILFKPTKVKKLYGIIPLGRTDDVQEISKDISARARNWISGPKTQKLYFCSYNSPITIDPTATDITEAGMSLGHEAIRGVIDDAAQGTKQVNKMDIFMMVLLIAAGMLVHILLQKFVPQLGV